MVTVYLILSIQYMFLSVLRTSNNISVLPQPPTILIGFATTSRRYVISSKTGADHVGWFDSLLVVSVHCLLVGFFVYFGFVVCFLLFFLVLPHHIAKEERNCCLYRKTCVKRPLQIRQKSF